MQPRTDAKTGSPARRSACPPQVTFHDLLPDEHAVDLVWAADAALRRTLDLPSARGSVQLSRTAADVFQVELKVVHKHGVFQTREAARTLESAVEMAYRRARRALSSWRRDTGHPRRPLDRCA
jgi:hypothetical protein